MLASRRHSPLGWSSSFTTSRTVSARSRWRHWTCSRHLLTGVDCILPQRNAEERKRMKRGTPIENTAQQHGTASNNSDGRKPYTLPHSSVILCVLCGKYSCSDHLSMGGQ